MLISVTWELTPERGCVTWLTDSHTDSVNPWILCALPQNPQLSVAPASVWKDMSCKSLVYKRMSERESGKQARDAAPLQQWKQQQYGACKAKGGSNGLLFNWAVTAFWLCRAEQRGEGVAVTEAAAARDDASSAIRETPTASVPEWWAT